MTDIETYFGKQDEPVKAIAEALRKQIRSHGSGLSEGLAWGFPCWTGNERIFSIIAHKDRCNLQLWYGADLAGKFPGRIEGTGKALRHVKIRSLSEIDRELDDIIDAALVLDAETPKRVR